MGNSQVQWEHRLLTRLTTIKLAVEILDRKAPLSRMERQLVRVALEASERLAADIQEPPADALPGAADRG